MGYKILNLLAKIFPGLAKLGREDWQPEEEEPEIRNVVLHSALEPGTPESLYRMDRIQNWNRGQFGDIELFPNFEELLIRRAFNEQLERQIIGG